MMRARPLLAILVLLLFGAGCVENTGSTPPEGLSTAPPVLPTATPPPTPIPTEPTREFASFSHRSGVFSMVYPVDWEVSDESTDRELRVTFDPPIGFGSRMTVSVTNEGQLTPDEMRERAASYLTLNFETQTRYIEISRADLPDGRFQLIYAYNDGLGGIGQETVTFQQVGPFFTTLRIFLSEDDIYQLSSTLEAMALSLTVDPQAAWGSEVASINPAELLLINTHLWQDRSGLTYFMGEVYNASPSDITDIEIRATICDVSGIVLTEETERAGLRDLERGGTVPFSITIARMPRGVTACATQVSARPAQPDASYTTALNLSSSSTLDARRRLIVRGSVTNPGLSPVTNVRVVIAVYDSEGRVIGYIALELGPEIQILPGQSYPVEYTFQALGGQAAQYVMLVEAETASSLSPSLNPTTGP